MIDSVDQIEILRVILYFIGVSWDYSESNFEGAGGIGILVMGF